MKRLVLAVDTLPVSTAACKCDIICSPLRTRLSIPHLSTLMFISMEGPPMSSFEPSAYVKSWIAAGCHEATDMDGARLKK